MTEPPRLPVWTIGDRLVKARQHAGLTQTQMAQALDIGRRSIVRYESSTAPPRPIVIAYSALTGVPLWWFDGSDGPNPAFTRGYTKHLRSVQPRILNVA